MARVDIGSVGAKPTASGAKPASKGSAPAKGGGGGLSAMDSKQKVKLAVAVGLLLVAGVVIALQFMPSGGNSGEVDGGQTVSGSGPSATTTPPPVPGKPKGYVPPDPPEVKRGGSRTAPGVPRRQGGEEPPK
jgi:hypothetical protein